MKSGEKFKTGNILVISFTHLIHDIYSSFINPLLPILIEKFQISLFMSSLLAFIQRMPALLNPLIGIITDKIKRPIYFVILTPGITSVAMCLLGLTSSFVWLSILCFISGLSVTFFHVPTPVLVKKLSGNQVGKGMSFFMFGGELARTLGPIVVLSAVSLWGLSGIFRLMPAGIGTSIFLFIKLRKLDISKTVNGQKQLNETSYRGILVKYKKLFFLLILIYLCRGFLSAAFTTFLPTYMNMVKGKSLWVSGISLSLVQLAGAAGTFLSGSISDRIGRKKTLIFIFSISPLIVLLFLISKGVMLYICFLLMGLTMTAPTPVILAMLQELRNEKSAFINSIFMLINFFFKAVAVLFFGLLGDIMGLQFNFLITAFVSAMAIPFACMLSEKQEN